ncbi:hypothetical protein H4R22_001828 [Coemansia sp. RSA 1290]|nr:hypothetical protein H4R22_001828 [Coemansia sp. RSA 1290]KAJ2652712.1 hypothetical protein IWW40_000823 [Coemansia sp. RSA 1250]KAJ2675318.1 hypothetical protein IWW42_001102 [Coemansia sp. RSA 1085]
MIERLPDMYGTDVGVHVVDTDLNSGTMRLRMRATADHITSSGTLDEALVATVTDNHTTFLLISHSLMLDPDEMPISVSVCLSVHTMARIAPGTDVDIVCSVPLADKKLNQPQASAIFVDARNPQIVYAKASHTKQFKDVLGYSSKL